MTRHNAGSYELQTDEQLESQSLSVAISLADEFEDWSHQRRAVYTSEAMETELDRLFPVEQFLQQKSDARNSKLILPED